MDQFSSWVKECGGVVKWGIPIVKKCSEPTRRHVAKDQDQKKQLTNRYTRPVSAAFILCLNSTKQSPLQQAGEQGVSCIKNKAKKNLKESGVRGRVAVARQVCIAVRRRGNC